MGRAITKGEVARPSSSPTVVLLLFERTTSRKGKDHHVDRVLARNRLSVLAITDFVVTVSDRFCTARSGRALVSYWASAATSEFVRRRISSPGDGMILMTMLPDKGKQTKTANVPETSAARVG